ncbi:pyruvate phosphate dikinase [Nocardiopsis sp. EMB25]|uniref:pyruvate phosphate dikinase n=1 Tax=Nocardiopsis sp. EMB25 TaxID=2835867 RepID=UPI0022840F51|nr:pyruvate phosphate dikinase [Nocardiopsis sp. EMB25]MCY9783305.1 pyruvate phosphate dikinase [Nocardiopsis sp. EMB25]
MVADLLAQELEPERWGFKAARLSEVVGLGLPVPPALCLRAEDLVRGTAEAVSATATWLRLYRPRRVVLRTSAREDLPDSTQAGRTVSVLNCPPDASALVRAIDHDFVTEQNINGATGACVLVQEQVDAPLHGVAFSRDRRVLIEAARRPDGVTAGEVPQIRARAESERLAVDTTGRTVPSLMLIRRLRWVCLLLAEHLGFDVDVEWAWTGASVIVLQVRPITGEPLEWAS